MIHDNHFISMYIGGQQLDVTDQKSLNLRLNNTLFDAATLLTTYQPLLLITVFSIMLTTSARTANSTAVSYARCMRMRL